MSALLSKRTGSSTGLASEKRCVKGLLAAFSLPSGAALQLLPFPQPSCYMPPIRAPTSTLCEVPCLRPCILFLKQSLCSSPGPGVTERPVVVTSPH